MHEFALLKTCSHLYFLVMSQIEKAFFILIYYLCWFTCVLSAAHHYQWLAFAVFLPISLLQIFWMCRYDKDFFFFLGLVTGSGILIDSLLGIAGFMTFMANPWPIAIAPLWIMVLWLNFSIVYFSCLQFLFKRYVLISLLAFSGFPIAYLAGAHLGAAQFTYGLASSLLLGVIWAVVLPLLTVFADQA